MASLDLPAYTPPDGMPISVWNSKYARERPDGTLQSFAERTAEMIRGNFSLEPNLPSLVKSRTARRNQALTLAAAGVMPLAGRHMQQGGLDQPGRHGELFTNCSTAATAAAEVELLLKGSGVSTEVSSFFGVDWREVPKTIFRLSKNHPDAEALRQADLYPHDFAQVVGDLGPSDDPIEFVDEGGTVPPGEALYISDAPVAVYVLPDTVEGWAQPALIWEAYIRAGRSNDTVIFDFSPIRENGAPIQGQQNRPACGPVKLIEAYAKAYRVATVWDIYMPAATAPLCGMWVRHYESQAVAFGGVRRSAKLTGMFWRDPAILYFITAKRGGALNQAGTYYGPPPGPNQTVLWSANNSVLVDKAFWRARTNPRSRHHGLATAIFNLVTECAYKDGTGEPAFINVDQLCFVRPDGAQAIAYCDSVVSRIARSACPVLLHTIRESVLEVSRSRYGVIVNPCAEVPLWVGGGYCNIGEVCLAHAKTQQNAILAAELTAEALIRVNRMDFMYDKETARTNRIGVGITGLHEFVWEQWGVTMLDVVRHPASAVAKAVGKFLNKMSKAVQVRAAAYATLLGMPIPHTMLIVKPSGTLSKVLDCTEGAHGPAHLYYLRNVQFKLDDPKVEHYEALGYPVRRDIERQYPGHCIVGFPTVTRAARMMGAHAWSSVDMTLVDHFKLVEFIEQHWLDRVSNSPYGGQVSYTANYDPADITLDEYRDVMAAWMPRVRCLSVLPATTKGTSGFVYLPEERLTKDAYDQLMRRIENPDAYLPTQDSDFNCGAGACPMELTLRPSV